MHNRSHFHCRYQFLPGMLDTSYLLHVRTTQLHTTCCWKRSMSKCYAVCCHCPSLLENHGCMAQKYLTQSSKCPNVYNKFKILICITCLIMANVNPNHHVLHKFYSTYLCRLRAMLTMHQAFNLFKQSGRSQSG